jgi:hypothetical protein
MRDTVEYDVGDFSRENDNRGVYARFYYAPVKNEEASAAEGRPVFVDKEFIEIIAAGNSTNIVGRKATDMDKRRFSKEYSLFKSGDDEQMVGTPLTEVPWITRSQVEELMYRKIRTLENLAELSDGMINAPGMYELKRKAEAWLKKASEAAPFTAMQAEMEALRAELAALKNAPNKVAKTG